MRLRGAILRLGINTYAKAQSGIIALDRGLLLLYDEINSSLLFMAPRRDYREPIKVRSALLQLIEYMEDNDLIPDDIKGVTSAFYKFTFSQFPPGKIPFRNIWFMLSSDFNSLYLKMEKLLFEEIPTAKRPTTANKRRVRALRIAMQIWTEGHYFETQFPPYRVQFINKPPKREPATPEEIAENKRIARLIANGTWRRGNTNS